MRRRRPLGAAALVLFCGLATAGRLGAATAAVEQSLQGIHAAASAPVAVDISRETGLAVFLSTRPGAPVVLAASATAPAEERALNFLGRHGAAFGVSRPGEVAVRRSWGPDEVGLEHVRLRQVHDGVPVAGGEIGLHLRGAALVAASARTVPDLERVETVPLVTADEAAILARQSVAGVAGSRQFDCSEPRLELFNRGLLEGRRTPTRLAWFVEARALDLHQVVWVDAQDGTILLRFSQLPRALVRQVYDAMDGDALPGTLVRDQNAAPTGDSDIDAAYDRAGDFWTYFATEHGRDSYDGAGAILRSTVRYCPAGGDCPYENAFWNGAQVVYGAGLPVADDLAVHEFTHGVIEHTADLFYYMQSGALSESYADIFGEIVDQTNGVGTDTVEEEWLLGEDVPGTGASRDMMNPTSFGHPASMRDWRFVCEDPGEDGGGVHSNSGVPNHAFALMAAGGTFNGRVITGIGLAKAAKVHYRSLANYLLSASGFLDHDRSLRQSCQDLVGTVGITAGDCVEVGAAIDAVELSQPWCGAADTAPVLCPSSEVVSTVWSEDFEGGAANWSATAVVGDNVWGVGHDFASSGTSHLWGDLRPQCDEFGFDFLTDSSVAMTNDVRVPLVGAYLQFAHAFGFENYSYFLPAEFYDGGVVEYSVNGGAGWTDVGYLIVAGAEYGGVIDDTFGNPLGGRPGFVGDSWGYSSTQLDLTPLAGQDVRLRFRIGTDDTTDFCDYGWFVDDLRVFECPASCLRLPLSGCLGCAPEIVLSGGGGVSGMVRYVGCDRITAGAGFGVATDGDLRLIAPTVTLIDGFFIDAGGAFRVVTQ